METRSVDRRSGTRAPRLQVTAVAAYFADALRKGDDDRTPLPGAPSLGELADRADELADTTEDKAVRQLAEAIDQANRYED